MYGYIYKFTNTLNGKCYIGKHKYSKPQLDESYITSGVLINKAIDKYGIDAFYHELICCCDSLDELNEKEKFYIKMFDTMAPKGYNLTSGGDGISEPTQEILTKNRNWHLGKKQSKETIAKKINSQLGKKHSAEWSNNISKALKGTKPALSTVSASVARHKHTKWYNDGVNEFMLFEKDATPDLKLGRLKNPFPNQAGNKKPQAVIEKIAKSKSNTSWYNNGVKEIMLKHDADIPTGFVKGRLKKIR